MPEDRDDDIWTLLLGFGVAAGFGQGAPGLALIFIFALVFRTSAKIDPDGACGRLLTGGQQYALDQAKRTRLLPAPDQEQAKELFPVMLDALHLLVIGHTQGGKTTLMHALALRHANASRRVLVCDPDAAPGLWQGCRVVGHGDNFEAIGAALSLVRADLTKRRRARAGGQRDFSPLHLVIDEAQDVVSQVDGSLQLIEDIARRGAKLGVHLTLGVQDKQVRTLGLEGKGDLRRNFMTVDVVKVQDGRRVALVENYEGQKERYTIPTLPDLRSMITSEQPIRADSSDDQMVLSSLLSSGTSSAGGSACTSSAGGSAGGTPDTDAVYETSAQRISSADQPLPDTNDRDEMIRRMVNIGMTGNQIYKALGGTRADVLEKVRKHKEAT
jgi:hypothetical protein